MRIGSILMLHGTEHIVIYANDCRALAVPLNARVTWKELERGYVHFMAEGRGENISPNSEGVTRVMTIAEMKNHFSGATAVSGETTNNTANLESTVQMKKTNQTATIAAATTSTPVAPVNTGKTGKRGAAKAADAPIIPAALPPVIAAPVAAPAAAVPAAPPVQLVRSTKGMLIGRGAYVMELAARLDATKPADLAEFTTLVRAKYPLSSPPWCAMMLVRSNRRIAERAARIKASQEAAAAAAKVAVDNAAAAAKAAQAAALAAATPPAPVVPIPTPTPTPITNNGKKGGKKNQKLAA